MNIQTISLRYENNRLHLIDQTQLPDVEAWVSVDSLEVMETCIRKLKVRGAPLIGVSAALALSSMSTSFQSLDDFLLASQRLRETRPTAVNLMYALDRMNGVARNSSMDIVSIRNEAHEIFLEDSVLCEKMAVAGSTLIENGDGILTHCNTGGLATAGLGTALGVIKRAHSIGKQITVYVDETRPLLQGGRLTTWELKKSEIPYQLLCDSMAGVLMNQGKVQKIFVGSDRIAKNGDFANKIGTFTVAVLAQYHKVPFYVVAPRTTLDTSCLSGKDIPIEMRRQWCCRCFWRNPLGP